MTPIRNVKEFTQDGEKITLVIPKFRSEWMRKWLIPPGRSKNFRIHLDETGSKVWHLIDGERNTEEICNQLRQAVSGQNDPNMPNELQIIKFLTQLYSNRFIQFK